jgi:hypothetical protein
VENSILSTLLYHSIFDYPLTIEEIHRYLVSEKAVLPLTLKKEIDLLTKEKKIISDHNFFVPRFKIPNSGSVAALRLRRQKISAEKMIIAVRAAKVISMIPWVKMVAVTGALAMENADKNDDIDLMIVVSKNRLWAVRPLVMILISIFFKRRRPLPNAQTNNNAICLNLWLDESSLAIPADQHNLYTAHELAQMKPVVNRNVTYEKIMWENRWGRKYLANAWKRLEGWQVNRSKKPNILAFQPYSLFNPFNLLNILAFNLQFRYMKSKMTNERVSTHSAFFHPGNRTDTILSEYDRLCHRNF